MSQESRSLALGLVGYPVEHSLSGAIHLAFLEASGLEGSYDLIAVQPGDLRARLRSLHSEGYSGLNVTFPHKRAVLEGSVWQDEAARLCGAANTLVRENSGWATCNTDVEGFRKNLVEEGLESSQFIVLGGGGAASAVALAIEQIGGRASIVCRRPWLWKGDSRAFEMEKLQSLLKRRDGGVLVNATTLGWKSSDAIPVESFPESGWIFFDLNYNPDWPWRDSLAEDGVRVITGEKMLLYQAASSFRLWTGQEPDTEAGMRAIDKEKLKGSE